MKIGILSDTHGNVPEEMNDFFAPCDELWHSGDIGSLDLYNQLKSWKPLRAVYGNIDRNDIRIHCPEFLSFECGGLKILMMHIGGYPPKYNAKSRVLIEQYRPNIFVCGHSHILKVMYDDKYKMLTINPGAAGIYGFHKAITLLRFDIKNKTPKNLEIYHKDR